MVVWLIGMSGAGKTVIGRELCGLLRAGRPNVVFLDGDGIREVMGGDLGHTLEDRRANAGRICRLCKLLSDQGVDVVCAILSIFPESRTWNRANLEDYFEVYIKVPFEQLAARDGKRLYARALKGEIKDVVGVDIEFPEPVQPDMVIDNREPFTPAAELARRIAAALPMRSNEA